MAIDLKDSASLLGSRLCHDLISPLGAISNGVELLTMSGVANSPELTLIEEAVASANARVKFFRVALGGSTGSQMLARSEILKLIDGCYGNGRLTVRWEPPWRGDRDQRGSRQLAIASLWADNQVQRGTLGKPHPGHGSCYCVEPNPVCASERRLESHRATASGGALRHGCVAAFLERVQLRAEAAHVVLVT